MRHITGSCSDLCVCKLMSNAELRGAAMWGSAWKRPAGDHTQSISVRPWAAVSRMDQESQDSSWDLLPRDLNQDAYRLWAIVSSIK